MKCTYCEWRCELSREKYGICNMYYEKQGVISERYPHKWSTYGESRIESMPFYHVYPGSRCMTIGTVGCNFDCQYCVNAYIAKRDPADLESSLYDFTPGELIGMAKKLNCHSIVFNVNEPTVSLPSLLAVSKEAKKQGIPMGCLTNAYMTEGGTEILASIFSFINISLKSLSNDFSRKYLHIADIGPVLRNIRNLAQKSHIEVTTPVIENVNDREIDQMAEFLAGISKDIPWHVFRLQPEYKMKEEAYPDVEKISGSLEKSRNLLHYVYFHNFIGSDWVNTCCPVCAHEVIERCSLGCGGDLLAGYQGNGRNCPACNTEIAMLGYPVAIKEGA